MGVRFLPAGDTAVVVEFGDRIERALSERVLQLGARLRERRPPGFVEALPTCRSLLVRYDPLRTDAAAMRAAIGALLEGGPVAVAGARRWRIPACYDAAHAPDLAEVAARTGLPAHEVVRLHAATDFHVYMIGFLPGFAYLGDLPPALVLPRRAEPRTRVPAGSVAIATTMSAVYPVESPGGWHLIGATPVRLFDAHAARPALLRPGDAVRFEPVPAARLDEIAAAVAAGTFVVPFEEIDR